VASALSRKVQYAEIRSEVAIQALDTLLEGIKRGMIRLAADEGLMLSALALAISSEHKLADCIYLTLAEGEGAGLATADRRLGALAEGRGVRTILVPSA